MILLRGVEEEPEGSLLANVGENQWQHDHEEEFYADYRKSDGWVMFQRRTEKHGIFLSVEYHYKGLPLTSVSISAPDRVRIHEAFDVFERNAEAARLPEPEEPEPPPPPPPVIFVGHGRDLAWRDLKDHLREQHGYEVEAYEMGARAGHAARDILEDMLFRSSFALLVMTGEDETAEGGPRARQNVVHEAGLFQGRLGFKRAIILLEEGTEEFSNVKGVQQIRFPKGQIKSTYGDVLATLKREFGGR